MTFLTLWRLWLLVGVIGVATTYLAMQRRRQVYALRFSSAALLDSVATRRPGWRRHLPAALFLAAVATLVVGFAQPAVTRRVPRERATVIVAIDTSLSMQAEDVDPTRLQAAKAAAQRFIDELPPTLNVGVVSFAGSASVLVPPTQDRLAASNAIANLHLAESTAIGEAIFTSLDALANAPADETGSLPPARIVLLSDGETTVGRPDAQAVAAAVDAEVPVSTIAFGTAEGMITYDDPATPTVELSPIPVPVGDENLETIADATGGAFFTASTLEELDAVYDDIGSAVGYEDIDDEVTDWFVGAGVALLVAAGALSLLWFNRLP